MSKEGEFFRPTAENNGAVLVRPYMEEAFRSGDADMARLNVQATPNLRVPLAELALSAVLPPEQDTLHRSTAALVMSQFTETVLEIAILKLADELDIDYERAYSAVFDGKKHAPIASSLFSGKSHPLVQIDKLMEPFLNGSPAGS